VRLLFWAGLASAAFACLDFYFQFPAPARFAEQYVWFSTDILRRAQGVFYEATTFGSLCTFLLVMLASIAVLQLGSCLRLRTLWLAAAALVLLAGLIFSFSRSAIASLAVALVVLLWVERERFRSKRQLVRRGLFALASLAGVAALIGRIFPEFLPAYFQRIWLSGEYLLSTPGVVLAARLEIWRFLWSWIADNPWHTILGVGYKTLPYSQYLGRPVVADNMYISLLVETGWIGLATLLLLNAAVLVTSYRQAAWARAADPASRLRRLFGLWMFCFWCGQTVQMFSGDILTYWRLLPLYFSALALGVRLHDDPLSGSI
jgi:O-antigen ligase